LKADSGGKKEMEKDEKGRGGYERWKKEREIVIIVLLHIFKQVQLAGPLHVVGDRLSLPRLHGFALRRAGRGIWLRERVVLAPIGKRRKELAQGTISSAESAYLLQITVLRV
jgi:hypothetical protein